MSEIISIQVNPDSDTRFGHTLAGKYVSAASPAKYELKELQVLSYLRNLLLVVLMLLSTACDQERLANRGFYLPEGDAYNGELLFTQYKCFDCHTMAGTEFLADEWRLTADDGIAVELGGSTAKVQTYGDLVSSIINPSHRIAEGYSPEEVIEDNGESRMAYYNSVMTVEELIDIVTFLETKYEFKRNFETRYPNYEYKFD